jgi:hypothetical protein
LGVGEMTQMRSLVDFRGVAGIGGSRLSCIGEIGLRLSHYWGLKLGEMTQSVFLAYFKGFTGGKG